jgi:hypothetical protein
LTNEGAEDKVNLEITFFRVSLRALGFYEVIAAGYGCMQDWLQTGPRHGDAATPVPSITYRSTS